jgi:galactose mutarotase-like enzyme
MYILENEELKIAIHRHGAELQSIFHKQHSLEYMWEGDPSFWAKRSPVLFPVVGALKEDTYYFEGTAYQLARHGFARNMDFNAVENSPGFVSFALESSPETLRVFPFRFKFYIDYRVIANKLEVTYRIENKGDNDLYFSVGGHPAFRVPLAAGTSYEDYTISFDREEALYRWPVTKEGLIENSPVLLLEKGAALPLSKALFKDDALVLKDLQSGSIRLRSDKTPHGLEFNFSAFPYLGLWAAPGADFVCIEPWCGIADSVKASGQLIQKEGINEIGPAQQFQKTWTASFF